MGNIDCRSNFGFDCRTDHKRNRQRQKKVASHHVAETAATAEGAIDNQAYY